MGMNARLRSQILGFGSLPEQSGLWGILLPKPGEKAVAHEPDAQDVARSIDERCLVLDNSVEVGDRGFGLSFGSVFSAWWCLAIVPQFALLLSAATVSLALWEWLFFGALALGFGIIPGGWAYRSARTPLPPSVYISRELRKLFVWQATTNSWLALDYDNLVPVTYASKVITSSGSATVYILTLHQLKPGTRDIEFAVSPVPPGGHPEHCGAIWEFIRRYMDGRPEDLPPIRLVPLNDNPKAWMARTDRTVFSDFIDDEHRIKPSIFAHCVVLFWGSLGYWWERAAGWIDRTAPRVPLPHELQATLAADRPHLYRVLPPTAIQQQAQQCTLPHMHRRWLFCAVVGTAVWGWLFGLVTAGIWLLR